MKEFTFDEDTYNIEFTFSDYNNLKYKLIIHANYQADDYIELHRVFDNGNSCLLKRFTNDGMDSLWEKMYENFSQRILVEICEFVKLFMELKDN